MAQYLPLPDGSYLKLQEGESPEAGFRRAQQKYPEAFAPAKPAAQPESGFLPALRAGATELGGGISALMGKVGLKDVEKAQAEYEAAQKRAAEIFKPTEAGWTEAPVTKFLELLGGSVPYMAAPLAAGAAAATLPVTGPAAAVAGLGAAGLASATQFTATNLGRQMEEGKKLEQTDLGFAALAAVPQAALDTLSMRMIPGIGRLFGKAGIQVTKETAKEIAEQGLKRTLVDYSVNTGKTAGIEGMTEAAQQVFERLQAGLNITDPEARKEYFDSFLGGAVLGGTLSVPGRYYERGKAQKEARGLVEEEAQKQQAAQRKAEEEAKQQPEYIESLAKTYQDLLAQKNALAAQLKKDTKEAPLSQEDKDANAVVQRQLDALKKPLKEAQKEFIDAGGPQALSAIQEKRLELTPSGEAPAVSEEVESPEVESARLKREAANLKALLEQQREQVKTADTPEAAFELAQRAQQTYDALAAANQRLGELPQAPDVKALQKEESALLKKFEAARESGDQAKVIALAPQLLDVRKRLQEARGAVDLLSPETAEAEQQRRDALAGEMGAGREAAGAERAQSVAALLEARQRAAQQAATQQQLELEGTAEREAMQELAASRAADMRVRALAPTLTAPQLTMFPEGASAETRPKGPLTERLNVLAERVLAAPNVDEEAKGLVRQVQDNLPLLVQRDPQSTGAWLYRTLLGTAPADLTQSVRDRLAELEAGKRSETEQVTQYAGRALTPTEQQAVAGTSLEGRRGVMTREPTGEVRRAVQTELAMPEQTATAFANWREFVDYLASDGLQALRLSVGQVFPTLANLQKKLTPLTERVGELQKQLNDINARRDAVLQLDASERQAASELLNEARLRLQDQITELESLARVAYVGDDYRQVDLIELRQQAEQRLHAALDQSAELRAQIEKAAADVAAQQKQALADKTIVSLDAEGKVTSSPAKAVRKVYAGQLPQYASIQNAQAYLQEKIRALAEADKALEQVVRNGIGQSWDKDSPTLTAYIEGKKKRDAADAAFKEAYGIFVKATARIPMPETFDAKYLKAVKQKADLDAELAKAVKRLSALRLGVRNAANRLNSAFVTMQEVSGAQFGEALQKLRNDLLAAEGISAEAMGRSVERQAQAATLAQEARTVAEPLRAMRGQVNTALREAQERAEQRRAQPEETQAEREARDAEQRREEQARLERQAAEPSTLVEFERTESSEREYAQFAERLRAAATQQERAAVKKELAAYVKAQEEKLNASLADMARKAAKNLDNLVNAREKVAKLTERLDKNVTEKGRTMTAKQRETAERDLQDAKRKLAEHERRYTLNTREMKITRTDIQAQRAERQRLLAEASGRRVEGERLGPRAIGPLTRDEVTPPKTMRTGSEESRAGKTTTDTRSRLTEATGLRQRDVLMTAKEMAEAEALAAQMKTLAGVEKAEAALAKQFKEAQERGFRPGERDRLTERQAILTARKNALRDPRTGKPLVEKTEEVAPVETEVETAEAAEKVSKESKKVKAAKKRAERKASAVEEMEEELDSFEVEVLPGESQEVFFSRGSTATPSTIDSVRAELKQAFSDLGRVQIYDSVDALVKANPQYEGKIPSDARGFVDTAGNKAFLIAENINQGQAMSVLLHEVGAHIGLKNALGEAQYNTLVNAVNSWEKRNDGSKEAQVAKAARARVEAAQTPAGQVNDELLAYTIEEAVNAGVKPTETKGVLGQWLSRVAALFRKALEKFGLPAKSLDAQGLVDTAFGAAKMEMRGELAPETAAAKAGEIFFSRNLPTASRVANTLVAEQPSTVQKIKSNLLGLGARTQFIDKLAPTEEALKRGKVEDLKATQALYYLRMYDQRMHFTSQAITDGVPERKEITRADGRKEYLIEAKSGANLQQVVDILKKKDVVKAAGSADAANKLFTLYLAALRAKRVGIDALNFGGKVTQADLDSALAEIESNPTLKDAFSEARDIYNQYNRNLIEFAVQTGAIGKDVANRLLASNDYVPYYRMRDGVAQLIIGKETPVRIGNLKDSPHLQELIGGDEAIFDFLTSSVQNTSMLLDMSMRNLATKNLMFELRDAGLAKISKETKAAPAGAVTFKKDGEEYFAIVDTDALGVDSELLVKGLAGIPTMFPTFVRLFGIPARLLRRVVVASPVYMARQLVRDSTSAAIASGANIVPVLSSLKQIGKPSALERRGITGGQVFTGMPEDQTRILKDMQAGKLSLSSGLAWLEAKSAQVDALTREAQYQSYREQGLSEMEATFMALESMNFSRRGLSPTVHMISTLIPFMNAQIQGLDVLYRAFTGKMSMNERLEVRKKLWTRGLMLAGLSTLYALSMDDEDEAYKNAKPEEKYGNWFVPIPGMEQPLRVPIPFELGYIFKALPEAMVNIVRDDKGAEEAWKAFKHIGVQTVPGLSSYFMPQAIKPALEVLLDRSFYTDRALESAREQMVEPGFRYRDNTTELAKWVGEATGFSPIKMEYLIRGYTGGMGLAFLQALSAPLGRTGPEGAAKRPSDLPVIGTLFQPTDASGIIDATYEKMNKVRQIQETYESLLEQGRTQDAAAYLKENSDQTALASVAGSFRQEMGEITKYERAVRNSTMTPDQKRKALDEARQAKIALATAVRSLSDRTERQAALA